MLHGQSPGTGSVAAVVKVHVDGAPIGTPDVLDAWTLAVNVDVYGRLAVGVYVAVRVAES